MEIITNKLIEIVSDLTSNQTMPDQGCFSLNCLASNPETPGIILDALSFYPAESVAERIAENKGTSLATLIRLMHHSAPAVRAACADNPNMSEDLLLQMALDECPDVRYHIAENPLVSARVIRSLCNDDNPYVSYRAQRTLRLLQATAIARPQLNLFAQRRQRNVG